MNYFYIVLSVLIVVSVEAQTDNDCVPKCKENEQYCQKYTVWGYDTYFCIDYLKENAMCGDIFPKCAPGLTCEPLHEGRIELKFCRNCTTTTTTTTSTVIPELETVIA